LRKLNRRLPKEACENNLNKLSEREAAVGAVCDEVVVDTTAEEQNASGAPRSRSNRLRYSRRLPKNYDGTSITTHKMSDLLGVVVDQIRDKYKENPGMVLEAWPEVIGSKLAGMTQAVSFDEGVLTVKVKNSTLHSLLSLNDKPRIMASIKSKFPGVLIKNIVFRIG
jgi:hypothetical protein